MSSTRSQKVSLTAGQQCVVTGEGRVTIALSDGVVEIAGILLGANQSHLFHLAEHCSVTMVTLEGGSVIVTHPSTSSVDIIKTTTEMASVISLARRDVQRGKPVVVAVIGGQRTGKSHAAQTYANILAQGLAKRHGTGTPGVYYADAAGNTTPGCLSAMELQSPDTALSECSYLWPSHIAPPDRVQCSFWFGSEQPAISATTMPLFLHTLGQLQACCDAMAKNQTAIVSASRPVGHVVYDLPTTDSTLPRELFYQRALDILRPTTLIITEVDQANKDWMRAVEEYMRRVSPLTDIVTILQSQRLASGAASPTFRHALRQYFSGTVTHPLGACKVVAQLSKLRWYRTRAAVGSGSAYAAEAVVPSSSVVAGCLCAISHARLDVEIPFANVCGVVFVALVDEENDECVLVVPAGEWSLPNNILVLAPSTIEGALPWKLGVEEATIIEEAVCA